MSKLFHRKWLSLVFSGAALWRSSLSCTLSPTHFCTLTHTEPHPETHTHSPPTSGRSPDHLLPLSGVLLHPHPLLLQSSPGLLLLQQNQLVHLKVPAWNKKYSCCSLCAFTNDARTWLRVTRHRIWKANLGCQWSFPPPFPSAQVPACCPLCLSECYQKRGTCGGDNKHIHKSVSSLILQMKFTLCEESYFQLVV